MTVSPNFIAPVPITLLNADSESQLLFHPIQGHIQHLIHDTTVPTICCTQEIRGNVEIRGTVDY